MRFLTRSFLGLFLATVSVSALVYAGATLVSAIQSRAEDAAGAGGDARERVFTVRAVTVTPGQVQPKLAAFGEVRSQRTLELRAPVGGRIIALGEGAEDGAEVAEGQMLFRVDPADAEAALAIAQSDLARASAELRDAERALSLAAEDVAAAEAQFDLRNRALERRVGLTERGVATEAALEEAELALASARQAVVGRKQAQASAEARADQARTALERQAITVSEAERRLADTTVRAGISGTLADVALVEGRLVNTSEQLARIIDPDALEVSVRVSTAQYLRLLDDDGRLRDAGAQVALEVAGYEISSPGQLVRASATVASGQSGREVFVELANPRGFRPGDFVTVRLSEPALDAVALLPSSAITTGGEVLVIGDDNRLIARPANVLRRQGDDVIIEATDLAGLEIVRETGPMLGSGILVRPLRQNAQGQLEAEAPEMVSLDPDRRARLIAQVESNTRMPEQVRARLITQLSQDSVPAQTVERLESGGGSRQGG
jgi:multidrug efflux pump subunit AcrA (membrane-fusion protein)